MASFLSHRRLAASLLPRPTISTPTNLRVRVIHLSFPLRVSARTLTLRLGSYSMSQQPSRSDPKPNPPNDTSKAAENSSGGDEVILQYVVLRRDLIDTWPLGSVVTQGCHASVSAIWSHRDDPNTLQYCSPQNMDSMHKVTLEVKGEAQIMNLSEKLTAGGIAHKLWIEQPENFPTCLATKPYPKSVVASFFKKLKLCK